MRQVGCNCGAGSAVEWVVAKRVARAFFGIEGEKVRVSPSMNVTAEIKAGKCRVIDYLLSPVQRAGRESQEKR